MYLTLACLVALNGSGQAGMRLRKTVCAYPWLTSTNAPCCFLRWWSVRPCCSMSLEWYPYVGASTDINFTHQNNCPVKY